WAKTEASYFFSSRIWHTVSKRDWSSDVCSSDLAATGWNWRMYNGNGSQVGWDLTGGTATLDAWSHVVGVWDGTTAKLYVNGVDRSEERRVGKECGSRCSAV